MTKEFSPVATEAELARAEGTVVAIGETKPTVIERRHVLMVRRPM